MIKIVGALAGALFLILSLLPAYAQKAGSGEINRDGSCRCKTLCESGRAYQASNYGTTPSGIGRCKARCASEHRGCNKGQPR